MKAVRPFIPASVRFETQPQQVSADERSTVNDEVSDDAAGVRSPNFCTDDNNCTILHKFQLITGEKINISAHFAFSFGPIGKNKD